MSRVSRGVGAAVWASVLLLTGAGAARGHAIVVESSPKPGEIVSHSPSGLVLRFNSRIEKALSRVTIAGRGGDPLLLGQASRDGGPDRLVVPLPSLGPGVYLVRWRVVSADGHVTEGAVRFTLTPAR